jgi:TonB family protein
MNDDYSHACYFADNDTTVYDGPLIETAAALPDAIEWLLKNNRCGDWNSQEKKHVLLEGIVEKDGTITNVKVVKSCKVDRLDREALRLVKSARYTPAKANGGKTVRSRYHIYIPFPPDRKP